jgi:hypothetical protein
LLLSIVFATVASAQSAVGDGLLSKVRFDAPRISGPEPVKAPSLLFDAPAVRQATGMPINGIVFGGLAAGHGDPGFAVGGGVQVSNLADRPEFGLQFDLLYANVGECLGCLDDDDFSASQFAVAGAFLYKFPETTNGWRPFAGGGVVYTRFSFSFDDNFVCNVINADCSDAIDEIGIQAQGGIAKGNLHFEGRVQGTAGGAFLALVGYKFGGM